MIKGKSIYLIFLVISNKCVISENVDIDKLLNWKNIDRIFVYVEVDFVEDGVIGSFIVEGEEDKNLIVRLKI